MTSPADTARLQRAALRNLIEAADPLCGKLEVIPGRVKLPPEYYPAAHPKIQVLREAVAAARAALDVEGVSEPGQDTARIRRADEAASRVHDYLRAIGEITPDECEAAIWTIHDELRAILAGKGSEGNVVELDEGVS